jgi:hypothetical protein
MKVIHKWRWVFSIGLIESRFEKDPRKQCELKVLGTYSLIKKKLVETCVYFQINCELNHKILFEFIGF